MSIEIKTTVQRAPAKRLPFEKLKEEALGKRYELSLVICADSLARSMNTKYRKKTYAANVLSFPYSKTEGEIFLNVRAAEREARRYGTTFERRFALLFVHGLLHLKGLAHGRTMESRERQILQAYNLA